MKKLKIDFFDTIKSKKHFVAKKHLSSYIHSFLKEII